MRKSALVVLDVALVVLATAIAFLLRENFYVLPDRVVDVTPYVIVTAAISIIVFPLLGLHRAIWRFSGFPDYRRIVVAMLLVVAASLAVTFALNRLDGVARSLPILQFLVAVVLLGGVRLAARMHDAARQTQRIQSRPFRVTPSDDVDIVLLIGLSRLTETYLQSIEELAPGRIRIAGILGRNDRHVGRLVARHRVLGRPEDLAQVVNELDVHGMALDRIIVTAPLSAMSTEARDALVSFDRANDIPVQFLAEELGLADAGTAGATGTHNVASRSRFEITHDECRRLGARGYWRLKRTFDIILSMAMIIALLPMFLVIALLVGMGIGLPITFWQQRPGLGGRPFRIFKFRTMKPARDAAGLRLNDEERICVLGRMLRRSRLDELPQLFSILVGDMSFVGPRPLLPRDQYATDAARLLVRPGLTGLAQIVGGRSIGPDDKAALDVWYIQNASFQLDLRIMLRTIPIIVLGERVDKDTIRNVWRELSDSGVLRGRLPFGTRSQAYGSVPTINQRTLRT